MAAHAGLDAFAALNIMGHMARLAAGGITLCATIHQPREAIWAMFHQAGLAHCCFQAVHGLKLSIPPSVEHVEASSDQPIALCMTIKHTVQLEFLGVVLAICTEFCTQPGRVGRQQIS